MPPESVKGIRERDIIHASGLQKRHASASVLYIDHNATLMHDIPRMLQDEYSLKFL